MKVTGGAVRGIGGSFKWHTTIKYGKYKRIVGLWRVIFHRKNCFMLVRLWKISYLLHLSWLACCSQFKAFNFLQSANNYSQLHFAGNPLSYGPSLYKPVRFWQGLEKCLMASSWEFPLFFGFFLQLFWPFNRRARLFSRSVNPYVIMEFMAHDKELFCKTKLFFTILEPTDLLTNVAWKRPCVDSVNTAIWVIVSFTLFWRRNHKRHPDYATLVTKLNFFFNCLNYLVLSLKRLYCLKSVPKSCKKCTTYRHV